MAQWLGYIESIERGRGIRLGLDRIRQAWQRLGSPMPAKRIVTVAGTNGKGSIVHLLYESLLAHRLRVGRYTSPHLRCFNERIGIGGRLASDEELTGSFERVYRASEDLGISYFEYVTLCALDLMSQQRLDIAILEIGLGGRFDAVNLIDSDLAIISSIGLDHCQFLGDDLVGIAKEKCGIMRAGKPALCAIAADQEPRAVTTAIAGESMRVGAELRMAGRDWRLGSIDGGRWTYSSSGGERHLPVPPACGATGLDNAAVVAAALERLIPEQLDWRLVGEIFGGFHLEGRFHKSHRCPGLLFDTAHNPAAVTRLLERIRAEGLAIGSVLFSARLDKDLDAMLALFRMPVQGWYCADFGEELYSALEVEDRLRKLMRSGTIPPAPIHQFVDPARAAESIAGERVAAGQTRLVCGSFNVIETMLNAFGEPGPFQEDAARGRGAEISAGRPDSLAAMSV